MPYLYSRPKGHAFLVERSVGAGGYNEKEDVKLVQHMLASLYSSSLPVNGVAGPPTVNLIFRFQRDMASRGHAVRMDGRVDSPMPAGPGAVNRTGSISHTTYTMVLLNDELKLKNKPAFDTIPRVVKLTANPAPYPYSKDPWESTTGGA